MKKQIFLYVLFIFSFFHGEAQFITEINYDNPGTDNNEYIEVFFPSGTTPSDFSLQLYNGSNSQPYGAVATLGASCVSVGGGQLCVWDPTGTDQIQNGPPDGVALYNNVTNTLVEFISYEGTFTGSTGIANGVLSTDTGVSEGNGSPDLAMHRSAANGSWFLADPSALPIELIDFKVSSLPTSTLLSFSTATELNNSHFVIERSADARTFSEIGRVQGAGTTRVPQSYTFTDEKPLSGLNYYRLRQVDFDGAESLSGVVSVVFGKAGSITIAPSPATDRVRIQLDEALTNDGLWQVFDNMGRQVLSGGWEAESADFELDVNTLPEGMYTFRLAVGTQVQVKQFRKL